MGDEVARATAKIVTSPPTEPSFVYIAKLPRVVFVDDDEWDAHTMFNPNEYPSGVEGRVNAALFSWRRANTYGRLTLEQIQARRVTGFDVDLHKLAETSAVKQDVLVQYNSSAALAAFESFLIASKGLLDSLTRLLATELAGCPDGFNKRHGVVGGRVVNSLKQNVPADRAALADELLALIIEHKSLWIDEAVVLRDEVLHAGGSARVTGFWMLLSAGSDPKSYGAQDVQDPELLLTTGAVVQLDEFVGGMLNGLKEFTERFRDAVFPPEQRRTNLSARS